MVFEFRLPDIGEGVAEGEVVKWFVKAGDVIREDAPLVSVLTDKANVEIPSPKSGTVVAIHVPEGQKVKVGGLLVTIDTGGPGPAVPRPPEVPGPGAAPPPTPEPAPSPTEASGGSTPPPATSVGPGARVQASPYVRRLAAERGIDLANVRGTGPHGRVIESDIGGGSGAPAPAGPSAAPSPATPSPSDRAPEPVASPPPDARPASGPTEEPFERVPIKGVRRVIAEHMTEATHRAATFTYVEEVDATELVRLRERMAKHVEKDGVRLSYLPFLLKAVVAGVRAHPWINARMDDEHQELHVYRDVHVGIATAAPEGLIVPVVRHVQSKSIAALAKEIQALAEKGRAGKLSRAELIGGTFTITSLGALGGVLATPILNYPEVAILGVHRIVKRPIYLADGTIAPANLMNLSLSLDHRILDGIVGAQFVAVVKSHLEDPHQLFADLA
ncbi:MAG TPA: dihydrolipoamide acetyltransferase family protein [Thermoplasmata archaeon]|nr:dihydrolipoamide acetyltransferase family protein [Thermoplasmata archaeon]